MPESSVSRSRLRVLAPLLGAALLLLLIARMNHSALIASARAIGWGILLVIALGGVAHIVKTVAWRLTMRGEACKVPFARTLGLRLASEAIGQFGFVGLVTGEAARVSLLGGGVSIAGGLSSVMLDRMLFIITGSVVIVAGVLSAAFGGWLPHGLKISATVLTIGVSAFLLVNAIAVRRRWPVLSGATRAGARFGRIGTWLKSKEATLASAEQQILSFYEDAPRAFWGAVLLNVLCHVLAILEVYIILRLLGGHATLLGALVLESLTKLINVAGAVNPGNVGTYEGGTMVIGRLVRLTASQGLVLALCRRMRAVFWAIIGALCLAWLSKSKNSSNSGVPIRTSVPTGTDPVDESARSCSASSTFLILAHDSPQDREFEPALACVATLPVALRAILSARNGQQARVIVAVNFDTGPRIRYELLKTGRVPSGTEWLEVPVGTSISSIIETAGVTRGTLALIRGTNTYHPDLLRQLQEWNEEDEVIELVCLGVPIGLFAFSHRASAELAGYWQSAIETDADLHDWILQRMSSQSPTSVRYSEVEEDAWQAIANPADIAPAEQKLNRWLVKPTDGIFARMHRRVSIPISRRLIKFPITPNMVSLFTLAVSLAAGGCFAIGGYWYSLMGALLSVWASILDGCDGEVARLKLQSSPFGCWLDTICDYLYYIAVFGGMVIGLARSHANPTLLIWGVALFGGAGMTFITASVGRKRLARDRPEKYLERWQQQAERRSAGFLLYVGRYTEFIVRRCFLPWLILVFATVNLVPVIVYMAAFGANVAWIISLRSLIAFSREEPQMATTIMAATAPARVPVQHRQPLRCIWIGEDDRA